MCRPKGYDFSAVKVGTHDATSRRDQSQGLVASCELTCDQACFFLERREKNTPDTFI